MKFKAIRPLYTDSGQVMAGAVFDVPEHLVRKYEQLERRGVVQRFIERTGRAAYTVTSKALRGAPENK